MGIIGILTVLLNAFIFSSNRKSIKLRTVLGGLAIQLSFAFIILKWEFGKEKLAQLALGVNEIVNYANEGINFLFGGVFAADNIGFIFAFQVLPIVTYFQEKAPELGLARQIDHLGL